MNTKSILAERNKLSSFINQVEGQDYINVGIKGQNDPDRSELGKMLALDNVQTFNTFFGKVNSMKSYLDYLTIPNYPVKFLTQLPQRRQDYKSIPKDDRVSLPNYYSLVALGLIYKIRSSKKLQKLMRKNKLPYTALIKMKQSELWGKVVSVTGIDNKLAYYVSIIRYLEDMIKDGTFYQDDKIEEFVNQCKHAPEQDIFAGIPDCNIKIEEKTSTLPSDEGTVYGFDDDESDTPETETDVPSNIKDTGTIINYSNIQNETEYTSESTSDSSSSTSD